MWPALLAAIPALAGAVGATTAGATAGGAGAGVLGAGGLSLMGAGNASAGGLGGLGAGLAPELGGAPAMPDPLSGLGASHAGGRLMGMPGLMSSQGKTEWGDRNMNPMVQQFIQQGMNTPDMSQPVNIMGLMNMLGGR